MRSASALHVHCEMVKRQTHLCILHKCPTDHDSTFFTAADIVVARV